MDLIDYISSLDRSVERGSLTWEDEVQRLLEVSDGMTRVDAADLIRRWRTIRLESIDRSQEGHKGL